MGVVWEGRHGGTKAGMGTEAELENERGLLGYLGVNFREASAGLRDRIIEST